MNKNSKGSKEQTNNQKIRKPANQRSKGKSANYKKKKNSKGLQEQNTGMTNFDSSASANELKGAPNHIEWYNRIPDLYNPAFSVPKMPSLGYSVNKMIGNENVRPNTNEPPFNISGVMSFTFIPMIGETSSVTSPINQVAQYMWKKFRTGLTSNGWYEPTDLMMYVMAADSIYMLIMHLMRIYGVATWYSATNRFLPERILLALGIHPEDTLVNGNLPLLRMEINKLIMKMSTYHIPSGFDYVTRHSWLTANIFADSEDGDRAQMYVFTPKYYWEACMVEPTETEGGPALRPVAWQSPTTDEDNYLPLKDLIGKIDAAIVNMHEVFDATRLSAEVDRVFGEKIHTIKPIPEDYTVGPTYNVNMLQQIKNIVVLSESWYPSNIYNAIADYGTPNQRSYIRYTNKGFSKTGRGAMYGGVPIIDYLMSDPTPDDTCYATRFMAYTKKSANWTAADPEYDLICGSEVITGAWIFPADHTTASSAQTNVYPIEPFNTHILSSSNTVAAHDLVDIALASQFKSVPLVYRMKYNWNTGGAIPEDGAITLYNVIGQFNNVSVVTLDALENMHEAVLFSLFNYPNI